MSLFATGNMNNASLFKGDRIEYKIYKASLTLSEM